MESAWGGLKRRRRRTHGRGKLTRDFQTLPEEFLLVLNLEDETYLQLVLGGSLESLPAKLAETSREAGSYDAWRRQRRLRLIGELPRRLLREEGFVDHLLDALHPFLPLSCPTGRLAAQRPRAFAVPTEFPNNRDELRGGQGGGRPAFLVLNIVQRACIGLAPPTNATEGMHRNGNRQSAGGLLGLRRPRLGRQDSQGHDAFHAEKDELLPAAREISDHLHCDDTSARDRGKPAVCTHIGNEWFASFTTTDAKSRLNFLRLLCQPVE